MVKEINSVANNYLYVHRRWRKAMTNLDSIIKSRDKGPLPTKVHLVKAMVFPVVMLDNKGS